MKYFMDAEFVERGSDYPIDLISLGIVCEDGREYYKQNIAYFGRALYDPKDTLPWIIEHVFPSLSRNAGDWCDRTVMKAEIMVFMDPQEYGKPEIWGYCSAYDHVVFCQLFGTMMDLPPGYPHYIKDFQYILDERGISDEELPEQEEELHNALEDARHLKRLWGYIVRNDCWQ